MSTPDFTKMVPGFDFLQGLLKGAGSGLPAMSQWIAPTLDAEEVDKRIQELRTVQFWLEQNARMLGATIQALEVQRMTLATIKSMNVPMADLGQAMKLDPEAFMPKVAPAPTPTPAAAAKPSAAAKPARQPARAAKARPAPASASAPVDPMQWWGALTQQFTELAARAVKDTPVEALAQQAAQAAAAVAKPARKAVKARKAAPARR